MDYCDNDEANRKFLWIIIGKSIETKKISDINVENGLKEKDFEDVYHGEVFPNLRKSSFCGRYDGVANVCSFVINEEHSLAKTWKFNGIPSWVEKLLRSTFDQDMKVIHYG